jgi:hypothetical protein
VAKTPQIWVQLAAGRQLVPGCLQQRYSCICWAMLHVPENHREQWAMRHCLCLPLVNHTVYERSSSHTPPANTQNNHILYRSAALSICTLIYSLKAYTVYRSNDRNNAKRDNGVNFLKLKAADRSCLDFLLQPLPQPSLEVPNVMCVCKRLQPMIRV